MAMSVQKTVKTTCPLEGLAGKTAGLSPGASFEANPTKRFEWPNGGWHVLSCPPIGASLACPDQRRDRDV